MSSANKYITYLLVLHLACGGLAYRAFLENPYLIFAAEALLLVSVYVAFRIFRSIIAPVKLLSQGAAALEDGDFSVKLLPTGSREMDGVVNVYNSMIDQLRSERVSGKQREEFLQQLIEATEIGIITLDFDGEVAKLNGWMEQKCIDAAFRTAVLQPALHLSRLSRDPKNGRNKSTTFVLPGPDGRRYHVEKSTFIDRGFERGFLILQDVTAELLAAEKEAYGKVIRMMAHEVNNSNGAVVSIMTTLLEAARETDPALAALTTDYLPAAINRADNMTAFIHNFARVVRLPRPQRKLTELNDLLRRTGKVMVATLAEEDIDLVFALAPGKISLRLDDAQIEQVVINALTNARQSIERGGQITITSTTNPPGFTITDDGAGIAAEHAEQLFTPFFSTKPTGQGIGLTLAREILEAHGARYSLVTGPDERTRFRVTFPTLHQ
ncbi:sensor histidine kinase [Neolewinella antarctica]|uniref:histidine kinase n=1 Tax=Neolewinella antarctica TaxID=442734 RepID=A0ABX0XA12_9BACT|nr:ATP-binding protein [Neolewinella antarctica]NJC26067.1 nitrogen fixation/metabolism regulation signal transduction histidine kinase [Neolewinella antarctica]